MYWYCPERQTVVVAQDAASRPRGGNAVIRPCDGSPKRKKKAAPAAAQVAAPVTKSFADVPPESLIAAMFFRASLVARKLCKEDQRVWWHYPTDEAVALARECREQFEPVAAKLSALAQSPLNHLVERSV